jgi:hypothetical protein
MEFGFMRKNKNPSFQKLILLIIILLSFSKIHSQYLPKQENDWLIKASRHKANVLKNTDQKEVVLSNGLIKRVFRIEPNCATVDYQNLITGEAIIRAIRPEAILWINEKKYKIGGLEGQIEQAYILPEWLKKMQSDPNAFQLKRFHIGETKERFPWRKKRWCDDLPWPPPGVSITFEYIPPAKLLENICVEIHYELFDGLPLLSKWLTITNQSQKSIRLNKFISENLAVIEAETNVEVPDKWQEPNIHIETDYAFHGMTPKSANEAVFWVTDSTFTSQVNYMLQTPCVLECRPPIGPNIDIKPGAIFKSFRTYELIYDSYDKERNGLALRKMYRTIAPWVTENPMFLHLTSTNPKIIKRAVDQCAEVGFEMIILSFGSGLNMEMEDPGYYERMKNLANYAHSKGIELGGYSLLASRKISEKHDVINPKTGKTGGAIFGNSPCLCSEWGNEYFKKITNFFEKTGFDILEHDGSYPGDFCASTKHPGHDGLEDSQWNQWKKISDFYKWCRAKGIYLNVPDWYFLSGSNKTGIGYREVNWSLPRDRQIMLGRQNLYDGTWYKTPSMGWTFVPLVEYHGGGEAATLEPLSEHLDAYQAHLVQNFGTGVQACYRGPRLYDTEKTKQLVIKWVNWYKKYRDILNSDIIHVRRPDGRDLDCILHVNPELEEKGLAVVYNPTNEAIRKVITLPLYYTGLSDSVLIREQEKKTIMYQLDRGYNVQLEVEVPGKGYNWYVFE